MIVFALEKHWAFVTLLAISNDAERLWIVVHSDTGPILLCAWYRPPNHGEITSILTFREELERYRGGCIGVVVIGDLNVHNR